MALLCCNGFIYSNRTFMFRLANPRSTPLVVADVSGALKTEFCFSYTARITSLCYLLAGCHFIRALCLRWRVNAAEMCGIRLAG